MHSAKCIGSVFRTKASANSCDATWARTARNPQIHHAFGFELTFGHCTFKKMFLVAEFCFVCVWGVCGVEGGISKLCDPYEDPYVDHDQQFKKFDKKD